jgi:hypothetical protein
VSAASHEAWAALPPPNIRTPGAAPAASRQARGPGFEGGMTVRPGIPSPQYRQRVGSTAVEGSPSFAGSARAARIAALWASSRATSGGGQPGAGRDQPVALDPQPGAGRLDLGHEGDAVGYRRTPGERGNPPGDRGNRENPAIARLSGRRSPVPRVPPVRRVGVKPRPKAGTAPSNPSCATDPFSRGQGEQGNNPAIKRSGRSPVPRFPGRLAATALIPSGSPGLDHLRQPAARGCSSGRRRSSS